MRKLSTSAVDAGVTLAAWLARRLGISEAEARARIAAGAIYVDGRRVADAALRLAAGQRVTAHDPPAAPAAAVAGWSVVWDGGGVLVVDKPAGLPVAAGRAGGPALDREVAAAFPGVTLAHRIDQGTSGLVLFARDAAARRRLAGALGDGSLRRLYAAAVLGAPPDEIRLDANLGPDPADARRMRANVPGGRLATSLVRVRRRGAGRALVEVELLTGRTHQIRVHLSSAGWPVLGDPIYGGEAAALAPRLALHAEALDWPGGTARSALPAEIDALV